MIDRLQLNNDDMLELEMANARGGNDWLETLEEYGNRMLADLVTLRRELEYITRRPEK